MPELYARIFLQILDSSLAEDWQARHVFEDILKLASEGVCDMTREALCRRTNTPRDVVDRALAILEAPDPNSRDPGDDGRRLARLDDHRDWGWRIVNWDKYDKIRSLEQAREKTRDRVRRYRSKQVTSPPTPPTHNTRIDIEGALPKRNAPLQSVTETEDVEPKPGARFKEPTAAELEMHATKIGLPMSEVEKFVNYYRSKGWLVGHTKMRCWRSAMSGWRVRWEEHRGQQSTQQHQALKADLVAIKAIESAANQCM